MAKRISCEYNIVSACNEHARPGAGPSCAECGNQIRQRRHDLHRLHSFVFELLQFRLFKEKIDQILTKTMIPGFFYRVASSLSMRGFSARPMEKAVAEPVAVPSFRA